MLAFICLFFPACITLCLWERYIAKRKENWSSRLLIFTSSVIGINLSVMLCDLFVSKSIGNLIYNITENGNYALKYLLLAIVVALVAPLIYVCVTKKVIVVEEKINFRKMNLCIYLYAFLLFVLNFIRIFDNNFWGDESYSIKLAKMTFSDMLVTTANDVHPPLYYVLMIIANRVFGNYGWVYHMVSLLPYIAVMLFVLTVVKRRFGNSAAILLITLISTSYSAVVYNVEVRMYSLAFMFVLFSYYAFYLIIKRGKNRECIAFIVASLGAAYSHYYALISVAFFNLALLFLAIKKKVSMKKIVCIYICTIVGYLPWFFKLIQTFRRTSAGFWITSCPSIKECVEYFFLSEKTWYSYLMLALTFFVAIILIIKKMFICEYQKKEGEAKLYISFKEMEETDEVLWFIGGGIAAVGTVVVGMVVSELVRPMFLLRYLYPVVGVVWMILCVGISKLKHKNAFSVFLVIFILCVTLQEYSDIYNRDKSRDVKCAETKTVLSEYIQKDDTILTNGSHLSWTILSYYFPETDYQMIYSAEDEKELSSEETYWVVWIHDMTDEEQEWFRDNGYELEEVLHKGILGDNKVHFYKTIEIMEDEK